MGCDLSKKSDKLFRKQLGQLSASIKTLSQTRHEFSKYFDSLEVKEEEGITLDGMQSEFTSRLEKLETLILEMQNQRLYKTHQQNSKGALLITSQKQVAESEPGTERNNFFNHKNQGFSIINDPVVQAIVDQKRQKLARKNNL